MTAIERTAYPRFKRNLTAKDLAEVYTPTPAERFLAARSTKGSVAEVGFLVLLKTYQRLGRFIPLSEVPVSIREHIARLIDPHLDISDLDGYDSSGTRHGTSPSSGPRNSSSHIVVPRARVCSKPCSGPPKPKKTWPT